MSEGNSVHPLLQSEPSSLSLPLLALWHDAHGDWQRAHEAAQTSDDRESAWVHAYLHRKEGDSGNAQYWYRRAGRPAASGSLESEWQRIADALTHG